MRKTPTLFCLFGGLFFVLFSYTATAQAQLDSLKALLPESSGTNKIDIQNKIARQLLYISHTDADSLLNEIIEESETLNYESGKCLAQVLRSTLYMFQSKFAEAKKAYALSIAFAERIGHEEALAYGKLGLGALYINKGEYALAYENHMEGVKFARAIQNEDLELTYLMNIGVINQMLRDYDEAEKFLLQALEIGSRNSLTHRQGQIHGNLGIIELNRKNYGLSIDHHRKAIGYFEKINARTQSAVAYQNMGFSYARSGNNAGAEKAYDESLELRLATGDSLGYARGLRYKAELFLDTEQLLKAQRLLSEALTITKAYNNEVLLSEIHDLRVRLFEGKGDFRNALEVQKELMILKDTLTAKANRNKLAQLTAEFEFEKLENENKLQLSENEVKDLKIRERNQLLGGTLVLLAIVTIWGVWKWKQLKMRLKLTEKDHLIAQQDVELRAKEFESDKLNLIRYADQLLSKNQELEEKKTQLENKISSSLEEKREIDELIEKLRSTINDEKDWTAFRLYFDTLFGGFFDKLASYSNAEFTMYEQRLIALIKISLSNKEIGGILNISRNSVVRAKHRLRQKFGFKETRDLEDFLIKL
ncbi:MAG: tetratricopeptide repeat protein [Roseivirga sp.]|nr:tetratricopeptide repeat protein [Roseivirga sp.]